MFWCSNDGAKLSAIDCWYPVTKNKETVCGIVEENSKICSQDYVHTVITKDKDYNITISPNEFFKNFKQNKRIQKQKESIEGEAYLIQENSNSIRPLNPRLISIKRNENVCLFGAWVGDIFDIYDFNLGGNMIIRENNEIHPINQLWYKDNNKTLLTAMVDGTGYFDIKDRNGTQVEASGLNQKMSFYKAFLIPSDCVENEIINYYHINSESFKHSDILATKEKDDVYLLTINGKTLLNIKDKSQLQNPIL
ncbi:MAG: hypothetical protein IPN86_16650 [Saprospiraceae bacterium]|nr:hypothetical protein [Saprospiraceae bacterium]